MDIATKRAIGLRVREKREAAGFTREKLGELSGLSPRFIANIEFGDAAFSLDSLIKVCGILGCSSDALLFGSGTTSPPGCDSWTRSTNPSFPPFSRHFLRSPPIKKNKRRPIGRRFLMRLLPFQTLRTGSGQRRRPACDGGPPGGGRRRPPGHNPPFSAVPPDPKTDLSR